MTGRVVAAVVLLGLVAACSDDEPLTQITVIVRSDIPELDRVTIDVEGLGDDRRARADLDEAPLPRDLALVHRGGPLGPVTVTVIGWVSDEAIVERTARLSFFRGENRRLTLELEAACREVKCAGGETCIGGGCADVDVDGFGQVLDGGTETPPDAGGDPDPDAGTDGCPAGFADCEEDDGDCETPLGTLTDCGGCGVACEFADDVANPRASLTCVGDVCEIDACDVGHVDADGVVDNGCEQADAIREPSNFDPEQPGLMSDAVALDVNCDAMLDTGSSGGLPPVDLCGVLVAPAIGTQAADGSAVVVLPLSSLNVAAGAKLTVTGQRPLIVAIYGDATVLGTVLAEGGTAPTIEGGDDAAVTGVPGVGAGVSCTMGTGGNGTDGDNGAGGGGGGAFGNGGGGGGDGPPTFNSGDPGAGGVAEGEATLVPLRGGCSGGLGGKRPFNTTGRGGPGGGGGALQLWAAGTLTVGATGVLSVAGGGGGGGGFRNSGGGGGGSGGGLLLEATTVALEVGAWLTANGGAGGEGSFNVADAIAVSGAPGTRDADTPAVGGTGSGDGGDGGQGGAADQPGGVGGPPTNLAGGGGGGGGGGRIRVNGDSCALGAGTSPPASLDCP